ncbi:hypothetical protein OG596_38085 (plasmid) [Streptomyces sp. NBC_01102]|uniref:hypothetical protein n=1 Tax=Streptomyces sp. NBC_01102 TaxID=2903749 RepID=UPI002F90F9F1|nr:hypothetical protein OG596_38085 [Streptomyces sp. NBC_01102]
MNTHALEKVARYRDLATAQLRCARWESATADPYAVTAYDAALEAVETATLALPADGTMGKPSSETACPSAGACGPVRGLHSTQWGASGFMT